MSEVIDMTVNLGAGFFIRISTLEMNKNYLEALFIGNLENIRVLATKAPVNIRRSPVFLDDLLAKIKEHFPHSTSLVFSTLEYPYELLVGIAEDLRFEHNDFCLECNLEKIDKNGQLIKQKAA